MWIKLLQGLIQFALVWIFGLLVSHSVIDQQLADNLLNSAGGYVLTAVLAVAPVLWYAFNRWMGRLRLAAAKELPANSTDNEVNALANEKLSQSLPFTTPPAPKGGR